MSTEALELKAEKGKIFIAGGKERYIIIPLRVYDAIIDAIVSITGPAAGGPLYFIGKKIGEGLVEEIVRRMDVKGVEKNVGELIKTYIEFLEQLGFGKIELVEFNEKHAVIKMLEPPSMTGLELVGGKAMNHFKGGGKMCYLEAGMLAAVFEKILGKKYRAYEVEHGTLDNPFCTIRVEEQA